MNGKSDPDAASCGTFFRETVTLVPGYTHGQRGRTRSKLRLRYLNSIPFFLSSPSYSPLRSLVVLKLEYAGVVSG